MKATEHADDAHPHEPARRTRDQAPAPPGGQPLGQRTPTPATALALQRAVGNRAATRALTGWVPHPDQTKKGVLLPDNAAAQYARFNPPKNQ